jgi:hypothetical protein
VDGSMSPAQALPTPRLSVCDREPLDCLKFPFTGSIPQEILDGLVSMGHQVQRKQEIVEGAGAAHCAEILKDRNGTVRATGDTWAVGVN